MTLRMRVLPRFPASISGANGLEVVRPDGTPDLIIRPDFGSLVQIPSVGDGNNVFFIAWDKLLGLYRIMSFNDLFAGVSELGFMSEAMYDPQGKHADAFARANHTGTQAISTVSGLQAALDAKLALSGGTLTGPIDFATQAIVNPAGTLLRGFISGLSFSNDTGGDVTNDFITSAGYAASDDAVPVLMSLASPMTKRTDAAWVAGTGNGGWLDGASMPNGSTGHAFLMRNPTSGAVDVGVSASPTAPPLPTGYVQKRRLHSAVLKESSALVLVTQNGDDFSRAQVTDLSVATAATNALITLSIPTGIIIQPKMEMRLVLNQSSQATIQFGHGFESASPHIAQAVRCIAGQVGDDATIINGGFFTNTSRQLNHSRGVPVGSINLFTLVTAGWIDTRGRI